MPVTNPIRIVVADDHELFRDGFKVLLRKQAGILLEGEASNGSELIEIVDKLKPHVVITDIQMPGVDGVEAAQRLSAKYPGLGIIALSMLDDELRIIQMLEAGARGYLVKNAGKGEIVDAIKTIHSGGTHYCATTSIRLAKMISKSSFQPQRKEPIEFTERELQIMQMICEEQTSQEIADTLHLSKRTVDWHRDAILEKVGARNIAGMVIYALRHRLFD